jgi:hypothetical protein
MRVLDLVQFKARLPIKGGNMRAIVERIEQPSAPLFRLYIHDAPHRRMHIKTIQKYREMLRAAFLKIGVFTPIDHPIELSVVFVNPSSPDLGNLYLALEQAMDGKTLKKPGVLTDDSLIQVVRHLSKMYVT